MVFLKEISQLKTGNLKITRERFFKALSEPLILNLSKTGKIF